MISPTRHRRLQPRLLGWLLAAALVLQSLIDLMPMATRVHAAAPMSGATAQDATARLLADLAVICTPYGLRVMGQGKIPANPAGKIGHDICGLCSIAAGASVGVLHAEPAFQPPLAIACASSVTTHAHPVRWSDLLLPPGRGPPN